jgi:hypothetical protein|tara:strand:+ start:300 stop:455 length:156 start_codon:yes stop_codon:yes gene_type:complete
MRILTMIVIGVFSISNSFADVVGSKSDPHAFKVKIILADEKPAEEEEPDCE